MSSVAPSVVSVMAPVGVPRVVVSSERFSVVPFWLLLFVWLWFQWLALAFHHGKVLSFVATRCKFAINTET
ncbi:hypothetical protein DM02DRAFT_612816 [Periconia macrospinosa]|uniref:Uncharacterized protein n=1 Tax=Periconia macrospinosa TaxID=97972 RepID=A0A2V1DW47_9PLEO|nr:hypothetical protein DM02DRAFT_612816 [Periconia macrospinosa]